MPTAEVLAHGKWSVTGYRRGTNYIQGYTNVGDFAGTFAVGIGDRAEIFTSFLFDTRIDRDVRPIFVATNTEFGSFVDRYPRVNRVWTGDNVGDWFIGGKVNLLSECRQSPAGAGGARRAEASDRRRRDRRRARGRRISSSTSSAARTSRRSSKCRAMPATSGAATPDGFETPGGAFRWGGGRGVPDAEPGAGLHRAERRAGLG